MAGLRLDGEQEGRSGGRRGRNSRPWVLLMLVVAAGVVVLAAFSLGGGFESPARTSEATSVPPSVLGLAGVPTQAAASASSFGASPSVDAQPSSVTQPSASSSAPAPQSHAPGLIAVIDEGGALSTVNVRTGATVAYQALGIAFGFPAWAPDGLRVAVVGQAAADVGVYVFEVSRAAGVGGEPAALYRSPDRPPFYLYWTPDSRRVSFLTTERDEIALRVAAFDRAKPLDGSDTGSVIRRGAPLYFQWVGAKRVLVHVGGATDSYTGQVGLDGAAVGAPIVATGGFRPATLSHDGRYVAYVAASTGAEGDIVVQAVDGLGDQRLHAFGPAAMLFDPAGDTLATIAADKPDPDALTIPRGPLRLVDPASSAVRTVLDGAVVAFFWAPDGKTIAAIRVIGSGQGPAAGIPLPVPAIAAVPHPETDGIALSTGSPVELAFVDAATGVVRAQLVVRLADTFVQQLLPYFDQYALSHQLWSPDSTAILLPLVSPSGQDQLTIVPGDGSAPVPIADGSRGSWSP